MEFLQYNLFGNPVGSWAAAVLIFGLGYVFLKLLRKFSVRRIGSIAASTDTLIDDLLVELLQRTRPFFLFSISVYGGSLALRFVEPVHDLIAKAVMLLTLVQVGIWGTAVIAFWIERYLKKRAATDSAIATTMGLLSFMARLSLFIVLFLLALNNLGINITALVAGLGVGGIAIALAVQNILGDLFASATIVLDKPFIVGDFIIVDQFMGTIEHIGLKTTRIRSLSGEQLIFPNSNLLQSRIRNFKRMQERRVVFLLGLIYQTSPEIMKKVPQMIREVVEKHEKIRFERCHFKGFGPSSLDVETVYWVTDPDYMIYMDIQQAINLELLERFEVAGIEFAYPTQTVLLQPAQSEPPGGIRAAQG
ncbi:MAG: mechanosensitive ion channel protein MscS [Bdellovibrionales bacterium GWB1_55_8]|nr:MAG: mechanosensitive ion channel protein MscS [Bdellovibrionales bacterium GWB1_55_8]